MEEIKIGTRVIWTPTGKKGTVLGFWVETDRDGSLCLEIKWDDGKMQYPYYKLDGELDFLHEQKYIL